MQRYKIAVLGASGSGKTVYLASLFNRLGVQRDDTGFFLSAEPGKRAHLVNVYERVASSELPWPNATRPDEFPTWLFTCKVANGHETFPVLEFEYLDYSGENFSGANAGGETSQIVDDFALGAISNIGMIDGTKVLAALNGKASTRMVSTLFSDLANMLILMQNSNGSVHFIITKWDILEAENRTIEEVRALLESDGNFVEFLKNRGARSIVRLIPVSSVGKGFATQEVSKDVISMRKNPGSRPSPFQVEMPMAAVLFDYFQEALAILEKQRVQLSQQSQASAPAYSLLDTLGRAVGGSLRGLWSLLPARYQTLGSGTIERLATGLEAGAKKREADLVVERENLQAQIGLVSNREQALDYIVDRFENLRRTLEVRFPASTLSTGRPKK